MRRLENLSTNLVTQIAGYVKQTGNFTAFSGFDNHQRNRKRIMIVDDQGFNIDALLIILQYSIKLKDSKEICDCRYDGKQALDLIMKDVKQHNYKSCSYDLILMDINMPVMDGNEATQRIRLFLQDHKIKQPMIVAITGHTEEVYKQKAIESGMNMVLQKPIQVNLLK